MLWFHEKEVTIEVVVALGRFGRARNYGNEREKREKDTPCARRIFKPPAEFSEQKITEGFPFGTFFGSLSVYLSQLQLRRVSAPHSPSYPSLVLRHPLHEVALGLIDQHAPIPVHGPRCQISRPRATLRWRSRVKRNMSVGAAPSGKLLL